MLKKAALAVDQKEQHLYKSNFFNPSSAESRADADWFENRERKPKEKRIRLPLAPSRRNYQVATLLFIPYPGLHRTRKSLSARVEAQLRVWQDKEGPEGVFLLLPSSLSTLKRWTVRQDRMNEAGPSGRHIITSGISSPSTSTAANLQVGSGGGGRRRSSRQLLAPGGVGTAPIVRSSRQPPLNPPALDIEEEEVVIVVRNRIEDRTAEGAQAVASSSNQVGDR